VVPYLYQRGRKKGRGKREGSSHSVSSASPLTEMKRGGEIKKEGGKKRVIHLSLSASFAAGKKKGKRMKKKGNCVRLPASSPSFQRRPGGGGKKRREGKPAGLFLLSRERKRKKEKKGSPGRPRRCRFGVVGVHRKKKNEKKKPRRQGPLSFLPPRVPGRRESGKGGGKGALHSPRKRRRSAAAVLISPFPCEGFWEREVSAQSLTSTLNPRSPRGGREP